MPLIIQHSLAMFQRSISMIPRLETVRFTLRKINPGDIETLHSYWSDDVVTRYMNTGQFYLAKMFILMSSDMEMSCDEQVKYKCDYRNS